MSNSLPDGISREHLISAIERIDQKIENRFAESTEYDVVYEDRQYPPKAVVGVAAEILTGEEFGPSDFSGGVGSKCFQILESNGFTIVKKHKKHRYWLFSPGRGSEKWDEFYEAGIMALPWDDLGDLSKFRNKEEIAEKLRDIDGTDSSKMNDSLANENFVRVMEIGDIIIAKKFGNLYLGYGVLTGGYIFDRYRDDYKSKRSVEWKAKGEWAISGGNFTSKILTDITKDDDWVREVNEIFGINNAFEIKSTKGEEMQEELITIPKAPANLNTILYGPPGTGKTYNSIPMAVKLITGKSQGHAEDKKTFDQLREAGQVEFVTFHQNYGYEDFMVGIKPDVEFDQLRFESQKGIFYKIAKRARDNYESHINQVGPARPIAELIQEILEPLERAEEIEIKMVSGISYWITGVSEYSISFRKTNGSEQHTLSLKTLEGLVEGTREPIAGLSSYYSPLVDTIKRNQVVGSEPVQLKNFVLIVDEINRANISRVFGELITLLEEDKRLGQPNELKITLPNGEKGFCLPPNLYLLGTMNTADKSIALVDIALRRRFEFIGFYPSYDEIRPEAAALLRSINQQIYERKKSADFLIGHAYFMKGEPIETVLKNRVIPLLLEYFANKVEIVSEVFAGSGWTVQYDSSSFEWNVRRG